MKTLSYLDNLVARHLPQTAVIQPRPVSLFEPWPGTAVGINTFPVPASEEETAVSPPVPHPLPRPQTPPIPSSTMRAVQQPASPTLTPPAPQTVLPPPRPLTPTLRPTSPEPARQLRMQPPVDDAPAAIEPALPRQPALTPVTSVDVPPTSPHHLAEPQPARETHSPVIMREQITLLKSVIETPTASTPTLVEIVREQPIQPLPPVTAAPTAAPEPAMKPATSPAAIRPEQIKPFTPANGQAANHQPLVTPPPEPAPTVQITIGRIEVRATPPPPARAEKKQPQTPVLSLDEYLRQRNGGRP